MITAVIPLRYTPGRKYLGETEPYLNQKHCLNALLMTPCISKVIVVNHTPPYVSKKDPQFEHLSKHYEGRIEFIDAGKQNYFFNQSWLLNIGLRRTETEFFMRIDIDCILDSQFQTKFESELIRLRANKFMVGQLYGHVNYNFDWTKFQYPADYPDYLKMEGKRPSNSHIVVSTGLLKSMNGYDEKFQVWGGEDDDVYDRLIVAGNSPLPSSFTLLHQNHALYSGELLNAQETAYKERRFTYVRDKSVKKNPRFWGGIIPNADLSYHYNTSESRRALNVLLIGPGCGIPIPPAGWGGIEKVIWKHMDHLRARGHQVTIFNERNADRLINLIYDKNFDIIHAHEEWGLSILKQQRVPGYLFTSHSGGWAFNLQYIRDLYSYVPEPVLFHQMKTHPELGLNGFRSITNGADDAVFYPEQKIKGKCVAVGRNEDRKKFREIAQLLAGRPEYQMYFIGPECESLAIAGNIHILGNLPESEVASNIRDAEYFFHLAEAEADALVVREAAMAGCKMILSKYCSESIGGIGWTDVSNFDSCPDDAGEKARETALNTFTWEIVGDRLIDHYYQILQSQGVGVSDNSMIGHLQCHGNKRAVFECLRSFRAHHPDTPFRIVSDGGEDFASIAKHFNCEYQWEKDNILPKGRFATFEGAKIYLRRIYDTCKSSNATWLLLMEEDVLTSRRIARFPNCAAAGAREMPLFPEVINFLQKRVGSDVEYRYGICGGSIIDRQKFMHCYERIDELSFEELHSLDPRFGGWTDSTLSILLYYFGHFTEEWIEHEEVAGEMPKPGAALDHANKQYYGLPWSEDILR